MSQYYSFHKFSRDFNEEEWIAQVRQHINEDNDEDLTNHVSIFKIPKIFISEGSELYFPRQVSIGPYHYLRDELYGMEKFKLNVAKGTRKKLPCLTFEHLVEQLVKFEMRIRACYNNFLDFKSETLAWIMAVDACFMIEVMGMIIEHTQNGEEIPRLLDYKGYKFPYSIILQDFAMLENQIPLFVVRKAMEFTQPLDGTDDRLVTMILKFFKELSPFSLMENNTSKLSEFHLLDFLYRVIIDGVEGNCEILQIQEDDEFDQVSKTKEDLNQQSSRVCDVKVLSLLHEFWRSFIRKLLVSRLVKFLTMLSWKVVSSLPPISLIKQPIEYYLYAAYNEGINQPSNNEIPNTQKSSLVEEIKIPSASDLIAIGVNFSHTNGGISNVCFDSKTKTIYLPKVQMKAHTEVVLKNLISYEAMVVLGPMVLTRYTELMNGIIDTEEDVRLLKGRNIIINHLKSDCEVVDIWNGMRKSVKSTKVPFIDKMIDEINEYYDTRWQVKAKRLISLYVFDSWKFFICLGIIFFILLMMIQTLFSIYRFMRF